MNPGRLFKLDKQTKRSMATIVNADLRCFFKKSMINAQLASQVTLRSRRENLQDKDNGL